MSLKSSVLQGVAASSGVGFGRVRIVRAHRSGVRGGTSGQGPDQEWKRFLAAVELSRLDIQRAQSELRGLVDEEAALMLDAHLIMHDDPLLLERVEKAVRAEKQSAEGALVGVIEDIAGRMTAGSAAYLRERARDVRHVGDHILRHLEGGTRPGYDESIPVENGVLVARDLSPADAVGMLSSGVRGMVTELGSPASHTALLARTFGVPAVVAVPELVVKVAEGSPIVVDGFRGEVLLKPSERDLQQAEERQNRFAEFRNRLEPNADGQAESRDGVTVGVWANLELPEEAGLAAVAGVAGVGLYRSEFLFLERRHTPSEDEQAEVYKEVVLTMKPRPVVIRTMDIGGDKVLEGGLRVTPPNPALGLRGLRLSLHREHELFRPQLRAILRAATSGPVRIMFPMVTDANEFLRARRVVEDCIEELHGEVDSVPEVRVGAMVELPSAVLGVERLVKVADFLSVGSNDLTQYVLGADRANPAVAAYSCGLHPSVLQMLNRVVAAANGAGVPVSLCGDMAADPVALPLVVGLGFRAISVSAPAVALAHEVVSRISIREAMEVADECLGYVDSETVRSRVIEHFRDQLRIIWEAYGVL